MKNKAKEKTFDISNFIGDYDNYITKEECNRVIKFYEEESKFKHTIDRLTEQNRSITEMQDQQFYAASHNLEIWWNSIKSMVYNFDIAWSHYVKNTGALDAYKGSNFKFTTLKVQKTLPTEGYHIWHIEHSSQTNTPYRAFVFSIYLNDVEEGGETEFLHFSKRVKPKAGRIVIWPAGFPYLHRGNPPLSGEKYLLTSWMLIEDDQNNR